jgi:UDP-N-acetylglucosamine acyltransferase
MSIHPTAIIEDGAEFGANVQIGPMCHVGAQARLGDDVVLKSHVVLCGATEIGARTIVHQFAVIGGPPQHLKFKNEPTLLKIGADCVIREHVTMNPGTEAGGGLTIVGDRGYFMAGAHVAHDCRVGNDVIFANNASLGGHVAVGDYAFLGGLSAIHQNCRVGAYAFVGGCAGVVADIIPYGAAFGNHAVLAGLNIIGMKRRGMARKKIHAIRACFKLLFAEHDTFKERVEQVQERYGAYEEVAHILEFVDAKARRSLMTPRR